MMGTPALFLCIILKNILDENRVPSVAYKWVNACVYVYKTKQNRTKKKTTNKQTSKQK
jgi:hypothetical protein